MPATPPPRDGYVDWCLELLGALGPVRARRMFGGHGLYADDVMVGLIADEQLYLKTDALTRERWEAAGGRPFAYSRENRAAVTMSYWTPPDDAMDSPAAMAPWARLALEAALRSRAQAKPRTAPKKKAATSRRAAPRS